MLTSSEYQEAFAKALLGLPGDDGIDNLLAGDKTRHGAHLALYRGNLHAAWSRALAESYPVLRALVGTEFFDGLARLYGRAHPSLSGDLNEFGANLSAFIADFEPAAAYPYFEDIARLEWALHRAYYAENAQSWSAEQWLHIGQDALLESRIRMHPACRLIESRFRVAEVWRAHQDRGVEFPSQWEVPSYALVVRPHWRPDVVDVTQAGYAFLGTLANMGTLEQGLDAALSIDPEFDFSAQWKVLMTSNALLGVIA
jgi:Putative DNA-binding domain